MFKSSKIKWIQHVARVGDKWNAVCEGEKWIDLAQNGDQWQDLKNAVVVIDGRNQAPTLAANTTTVIHTATPPTAANTTQQWQNAASRGTPKQSFIACPSAILWPGIEPCLRGERPVTNRLSHGAA